MNIDQSGWQFHDNSRVYTIAGDLHLTEQSSPQEFTAVLAELRARIRALEGVPESERVAVDTELAEVDTDLTEGAKDDDAAPADGDAVAGDAVAGKLARIANRLRLLRGTTTAALELGDSLDSMAHWAGQHF